MNVKLLQIMSSTYTEKKNKLLWRSAMALCFLLIVQATVLYFFNSHFQIEDGAKLNKGVFYIAMLCMLMLVIAPENIGPKIFLSVILILLVVIQPYGYIHGRSMQLFAFLLPITSIFLFRPNTALVLMLLYGVFTLAFLIRLVETIDAFRFFFAFLMNASFVYIFALWRKAGNSLLRFYYNNDTLTECPTRHRLNIHLDSLHGSSFDGVVSFLLVEIDNLEDITDKHGLLAGDHVIADTARLLKTGLLNKSELYRYRNTTFAIALQMCDKSNAAILAERLRTMIERHDFNLSQSHSRMTVSCSVSEWYPKKNDVSDALNAAVHALQAAKAMGGNRVIIAPEPV